MRLLPIGIQRKDTTPQDIFKDIFKREGIIIPDEVADMIHENVMKELMKGLRPDDGTS